MNQPIKMKCPICKKKVKQTGLSDHIRDVHDNFKSVKSYEELSVKVHPVEKFAANLWRNP